MLGLDKNDAAFEGYGEQGLAETADLVKALQAQEGITDIAQLQGGGALQPQSLETQLAMLTFQEKHIKFFKDIGIQKAFSTLEEYSVQDGYGSEGGFVGQLENPEEDDAEFRRQFAVVKYIRTLWRVGDVLQYARTITDAEVVQVQAAMMRALRATERTLFFGDTDLIPQSFDGLYKAIKDGATVDHIIDLRGATLTEAIFKQAAELISTNYGTPTKCYVSNSVQTTIDNILVGTNSAQRFLQNTIGSGGINIGHKVPGMHTSFGDFNFEPDIFINPESQGVPKIKDPSNPGQFIEGATSNKAPATPTFTATPVAPTLSDSLFAASGSGGAINGNYKYRVVAVNQYGKSAAATVQNATVAVAGGVDLAITSGGGSYAPTSYEIYRETTPGSGVIVLMKAVKFTGSPMTVRDLNADLPGTSIAFLVDNTTVGEMRTMALSQLAPIHKQEYAKIGPYRWGTVNFYAVPKWYAPLRFVAFKNVGVQKLIRNPLIDM